MAFVKSLVRVDESRQYLCGHSMGGYGAWHIAHRSADVWAALGIHAGALQYDARELDASVATALRDLPTYFVVGTVRRPARRQPERLRAAAGRGQPEPRLRHLLRRPRLPGGRRGSDVPVAAAVRERRRRRARRRRRRGSPVADEGGECRVLNVRKTSACWRAAPSGVVRARCRSCRPSSQRSVSPRGAPSAGRGLDVPGEPLDHAGGPPAAMRGRPGSPSRSAQVSAKACVRHRLDRPRPRGAAVGPLRSPCRCPPSARRRGARSLDRRTGPRTAGELRRRLRARASDDRRRLTGGLLLPGGQAASYSHGGAAPRPDRGQGRGRARPAASAKIVYHRQPATAAAGLRASVLHGGGSIVAAGLDCRLRMARSGAASRLRGCSGSCRCRGPPCRRYAEWFPGRLDRRAAVGPSARRPAARLLPLSATLDRRTVVGAAGTDRARASPAESERVVPLPGRWRPERTVAPLGRRGRAMQRSPAASPSSPPTPATAGRSSTRPSWRSSRRASTSPTGGRRVPCSPDPSRTRRPARRVLYGLLDRRPRGHADAQRHSSRDAPAMRTRFSADRRRVGRDDVRRWTRRASRTGAARSRTPIGRRSSTACSPPATARRPARRHRVRSHRMPIRSRLPALRGREGGRLPLAAAERKPSPGVRRPEGLEGAAGVPRFPVRHGDRRHRGDPGVARRQRHPVGPPFTATEMDVDAEPPPPTRRRS